MIIFLIREQEESTMMSCKMNIIIINVTLRVNALSLLPLSLLLVTCVSREKSLHARRGQTSDTSRTCARKKLRGRRPRLDKKSRLVKNAFSSTCESVTTGEYLRTSTHVCASCRCKLQRVSKHV